MQMHFRMVVALLFAHVGFLGLPVVGAQAVGGVRHPQVRRFEQLKNALAEDPDPAVKLGHIARYMDEETGAWFRTNALESALNITGRDLEKFLLALLANETDSGIRQRAVAALGHLGSDECLPVLVCVASTDRPSTYSYLCMGGVTSARRAAMFAIVEFAARFPTQKDVALAEVRALPYIADQSDAECLGDARTQVLYQLTRDSLLLTPFFARLKSSDPKVRIRAVALFRGLSLRSAPREVIHALRDSSPDVRAWAALVLGEIGDPSCVRFLMAVANDSADGVEVRCNAIAALGQMRAREAGTLMEELLADGDPFVSGNAARALFCITGRKLVDYPLGQCSHRH